MKTKEITEGLYCLDKGNKNKQYYFLAIKHGSFWVFSLEYKVWNHIDRILATGGELIPCNSVDFEMAEFVEILRNERE